MVLCLRWTVAGWGKIRGMFSVDHLKFERGQRRSKSSFEEDTGGSSLVSKQTEEEWCKILETFHKR